MKSFLEKYHTEIAEDLAKCFPYKESTKDIIMIVHNELDYVRLAIDSVISNTSNFNLYVWDNGSDPSVAEYLFDKMYSLEDNLDKNMIVVRSIKNLGFVIPNNNLVKLGSGQYVILLNSDTQVYAGWDRHLIGFLQNNPDYLEVGYQGGILDETGLGIDASLGNDIDYICGWCACFARNTYNAFGLFDDKFEFAYFEDADFSLRLKKDGHKIYALHLATAHHFGNKTIKTVQKSGNEFVCQTFQKNHEYMKKKWSECLEVNRVRAEES